MAACGESAALGCFSTINIQYFDVFVVDPTATFYYQGVEPGFFGEIGKEHGDCRNCGASRG